MNILLTGATRGLGECIAGHLVKNGHVLWLLGRSKSDSLTQLMDNHPTSVHFFECDLLCTSTLRSVLSSLGRDTDLKIDGVVNNAATAYDDLVTNMQLTRLEDMFRTNVYAPIEITRFAIRNMLLHKTAGSIVHVGSICSKTGFKGLSMYAATKGALEAFSRSIAREWGGKNIRSNCVVPGFMETQMSSSLDIEQRERIYRRSSLGRPTELTSVAATVEFLLSPQSSSITGQEIIVDAGTI